MENQSTQPTANTTMESTASSPTTSASSVLNSLQSEVNANVDSTNNNISTNTDAWYSSIKDDELRGYAETKNFQSVDEMLASYKNIDEIGAAEKANKTLVLPKDKDDIDGYNNLYKQLGRPDKAEDYQLSVPEGQDNSLAKSMSEKFFEAGLSKDQAQQLTNHYNEIANNMLQRSEKDFSLNSEHKMNEWKTERGVNADRDIENSRRFVAATGLTGEDLSKMERSIGTKKMMDFLSSAGSLSSEDEFVSANSSGNKLMSKEAARVEIKRLQQDAEFRNQLLNKNVAAEEKWARLQKQAFGII